MCNATMLCCSRTADPSSRSSTCHFLGAGGYSSNTGNLYEGKPTQRGIITSRFNMHTRLHRHIHTNTCLLTLRTCKFTVQTSFDSWTESARPSAQGAIKSHYKTTLKHVARPIRKICQLHQSYQKSQCKCVTRQPKQSPCSSFLHISSAKTTSDLQ